MMNLTDNDFSLVAGIKQGREDSFKKLYLKYYPRFYAFTLRFIKNPEGTEDILQNVFLRIWLKRHSLDPTLPIVKLIFVYTKYEIIDHLARQRKEIDTKAGLLSPALSLQSGADIEYDFIELYDRINCIINNMPEKRRKIFKMNRYEFKTASQIAKETGLSIRTVEKHIELALRTIRETIGPLISLILFLYP